MLPLLYTAFLFALSCSCTQVPLGLKLDATADLPTLTLPYATYRAASFNPFGSASLRVCV